MDVGTQALLLKHVKLTVVGTQPLLESVLTRNAKVR